MEINLNDALHFDISTSVIKQLGEQLISDEVTAIMELIKNSYDAEADWVKIDIDVNNKLSDEYHFKNELGYIILEDCGDGMSLADINSRWLVISFSAKREQKEKGELKEGKRIPLGDKGLGRLSTQRIGKKIEIITGVEKEDVYHSLAYDWDDFDGKRKLSDVNVTYKTFPKKIGIKGTKIVITSLNNPNIWKGDAFNVFRGELSKLIFPIKDKRPFSVRLAVSGQKVDLDLLNEQLQKKAIGDYKIVFDGKKLKIDIKVKLAKLRGNENQFFEQNILPDNGQLLFSFLTDKIKNKKYFIDDKLSRYIGNIKGDFFEYHTEYSVEEIATNLIIVNNSSLLTNQELLEENTQLSLESMANNSIITNSKLVIANPGAFEGEIFEYDMRGGNEQIDENEEVQSTGDYKKIVKSQTGVRIFRDGFGIKPYGMNDNDWLKLSSGQTSGPSFYGIRPGNIIGYISISNKHNLCLTEKTDREGFIETPYAKNFFALTQKFVSEINGVLLKVRRGLVDYKSQLADEQGGFAGSTSKAIEGVVKVTNSAKSSKTSIPLVINELDQTSKKIKNKQNSPLFNQGDTNFEQQKLILEIDALINKAIHELSIAQKIIDSAALLGANTDFIAPQIDSMKKQLSDFSELAGLGLTAETWSHEILNMVERVSSLTNDIEKRFKKEKDIDSAIFIYVENIKSFINNLRIQVNHFSPSLRYNREKKHDLSMSIFITDAKDFFISKFEKIGGVIEIKIKDDFRIKANKGKLTQVLDNILLNSEYWLKQKRQREADFVPMVFIEINNPFVSIWDNGFGINESYEESIFQPFVTSKPVGEGRGLGLYIVSQILESMGGEITLLQKRNANNRRYIFEINLESAKT